MALRKVLPELIIVLVVLLSCSLLAGDVSAAYRYGRDNDGNIEGPVIKQLSKKLDDPGLEFLAGNWGAKFLQFLRPVPGDVDLGVSPDEQQGGGGLLGETVRIINGNSFVSRADVFFASAHTLGLGFSAFYNSQSAFAQSLGVGWSHTYSVILNPSYKFRRKTYIRVVDASGQGHYFRKNKHGMFKGAFQERSHLTADPGGFIWHRLNGSKYGFSDIGRLSWIDDEKGNRLQLDYDGQDRLDTVTDIASGRTLTFNYNEDDLIESIAGPVTAVVANGIRVMFGYDANLNLASVTYADDSGFDYTYADGQDVHNLTAIHNRAGHLINTWSYDDEDRCIENFSPSGRGVTVNYVSNRRVKVTDAYGVERTYVLKIIKGHKRLSAVQGPASPPYADTPVRKWRYDDKLRLVRVELANGAIHKYRNYDRRGNPRRIVLAAGTEKKRKIHLTYHPRMNAFLSRTEASVRGPGKKVTIFDFDDDGNVTPNQNPTGLLYRIIEQGFTHNQDGDVTAYEYITRFSYNDRGQVLAVDGPLPGEEDTTEFSYDPTTGDLDTVIRPLIGATSFLEYDAAGNPGKVIDVNGQATRLNYDGRGRVTAAFHDADQSVSSISYNTAGLPDTTTDEDGVYKNFAYDADYARLSRIYDFENNYIHHNYDARGNLIERSRHDPAGDRYSRHRWSYESPDIPGKLHRVISFDDTYTEYRYDSAGNLASMTDPEANTTEYQYDVFNRLNDVIQTMDSPGDVVTSYEYDAHGNLSSVTDAEHHQTIYEYDDMGRTVMILSPDTGTTRYAYDEVGSLISKTDAKGITTTYSYDILNRLTAVVFPDATQNITYSYDQGQFGKGRRTGMTDPSGITTFGYSGRGRMVSKISTVNNIAYNLTRTFSPGGRLNAITYPSGRSIDYTRYDSGKIKNVATTFNALTTALVSISAYNPFGRPSGMNTGFGGNINNQSSECACLEVANPGSFMEQQYIYDGNRNMISITGTKTPWFNQDFEYDSLLRLKQAIGTYGTINYTYDRVGNRQTRTIDAQTEIYKYYPGTNRLQEVSGNEMVSYTYDLNGNITGIGDKALSYNQNNRLIQVKKNADIIGEYVYNGLGQRVTKTASGKTTVFLYDFDGNIIAEGQLDGTLSSDYLYMFGNRIARVDIENEAFFYFLNNYLGTPILMTNEKGGIVWEASYKPFGEVDIGSNSLVVSNFRFPGQYYDDEIGLNYNYNRYYDSKIGRYLTPDPIGLIGGDNLFVYVSNNPLNFFDRFGLEMYRHGYAPKPFRQQLSQFGYTLKPSLGKVDPGALKPGADSTTGPVLFITAGASLAGTGAQVAKIGAGIFLVGGPVGWVGGTVVVTAGVTIVVIGSYSVYKGIQTAINNSLNMADDNSNCLFEEE